MIFLVLLIVYAAIFIIYNLLLFIVYLFNFRDKSFSSYNRLSY